ncbi:hypothetical protein WL37_17235 [Burkholderia ubonensis]|nr:hypothetical protein WL37_17235 [Burkholderia ubonensis]
MPVASIRYLGAADAQSLLNILDIIFRYAVAMPDAQIFDIGESFADTNVFCIALQHTRHGDVVSHVLDGESTYVGMGYRTSYLSCDIHRGGCLGLLGRQRRQRSEQREAACSGTSDREPFTISLRLALLFFLDRFGE